MSFESIHVALAGNPNSGKTSIFNHLTRSRQRVANYPGVTVETSEGTRVHRGVTYRIVDLPGTYSLTAHSPEECIARDYVAERHPDVVVQVIDASNLERSLFLTLQLLELGVRVVLDLNMIDEAEARGLRIDDGALGRALGVEVVETIGNRNVGTERLLEAIARARDRAPVKGEGRYAKPVESLIDEFAAQMHRHNGFPHPFPLRWAAVRYLEGDPAIREWVGRELTDGAVLRARLDGRLARLSETSGMGAEALVAEARYAAIGEILGSIGAAKTPGPSAAIAAKPRRTMTERIDAVLLHRALGLPLLALSLYLLFQFVFTLGDAPMRWIDGGMTALSALIRAHMADGPLRSLLVDGAIGGVGTVIVFLPNILLLFFALGLLERSGYMARAAFLLDRMMNGVGLHGRSFVPMLTGFGCSIPAVMATRTMEHERDRLATMAVIPLMSCSARLTIFCFLVPAFFPVAWRGAVYFSLYAIGIAVAIVLVKLLRVTVLKGEMSPFVMEMPPYRWPTLRSVLGDMQQQSWQYLRKAGTIILAISIVLWAATSYPKPRAYAIDGSARAAAMSAAQLAQAHAGEDLGYSVAGRLGRAMEPVFRPLGFDWRVCTALIGALAAKEVFVAQLGIVYSLGDDEKSQGELRQTMARAYSPLQAFCMMLFCLLSMPCMSTFAIVKRESNSRKWPLLQAAALTLLAYGLTLAVYQIGVHWV